MADEEIIEVTVDIAELKKMKVPELKRKLAELGLPTKGTKVELLVRVEKYINEQEEEEEDLLEEDELVESGEGGEGGDQTTEPQQPVVQETSKDNETADDEVTVETKSTPSQPPVAAVEGKTAVAKMTAEERAELRAKKFGSNTSEAAKKSARAERFGVSSYDGLGKRAAPTGAEVEKMKKRGERFGGVVAPAMVQLDETDKKKQRLERFGTAVADLSAEERKRVRAERFGAS